MCDCKESVITSKVDSATVSKDKNGKISGFSTSWIVNDEDGSYSSSYSYQSDNENVIRMLAKEFGVNID